MTGLWAWEKREQLIEIGQLYNEPRTGLGIGNHSQSANVRTCPLGSDKEEYGK